MWRRWSGTGYSIPNQIPGRSERLTEERESWCPEFEQVPISDAWASYIDSTPDGTPAIGEVAGIPGFILAAGFSGHGFGIGPGAGHLIADIITGSEPIVDPRPYRPERLKTSVWCQAAEFWSEPVHSGLTFGTKRRW
jgi:glycine/D-amino acid oxidase-like deaminating enzyme